jgi:hypothetical protein
MQPRDVQAIASAMFAEAIHYNMWVFEASSRGEAPHEQTN